MPAADASPAAPLSELADGLLAGTTANPTNSTAGRLEPDTMSYSGDGDRAARRLGSNMMRVVLASPTVLNWLSCIWARFPGTAQVHDSDGFLLTVQRSRTLNFEFIFYCSAVTSITTLFAHLWLTLGGIARDHRLSEGSSRGQETADRRAAAANQARKLNWQELAHVAVVAFDFFFAAMVVFRGGVGSADGDLADWGDLLEGFVSSIPALMVLATAMVVSRARAAIVRTQGTDTALFAAAALRGSLVVLLLQAAVLARFALFAFKYEVGLFAGDCTWVDNPDPLTNHMWPYAAPIRSCNTSLFLNGTASRAELQHHHLWHPGASSNSSDTLLVLSAGGACPLNYNCNGSLAVIYYLGIGSLLYFVARGQDLLSDRLLTELEMHRTEVAALTFSLLSTGGVLYGAAMASAEWAPGVTDLHAAYGGAPVFLLHTCCAGGIFGVFLVLWFETVVAAVRGAIGSGPPENQVRY
eukprot:SAG22_NODE_2392_length_2623_cov_5.797544_2_plen_469_part_00